MGYPSMPQNQNMHRKKKKHEKQRKSAFIAVLHLKVRPSTWIKKTHLTDVP